MEMRNGSPAHAMRSCPQLHDAMRVVMARNVPRLVIPGQCEALSPEPRGKRRGAGPWLPARACGATGMTRVGFSPIANVPLVWD